MLRTHKDDLDQAGDHKETLSRELITLKNNYEVTIEDMKNKHEKERITLERESEERITDLEGELESAKRLVKDAKKITNKEVDKVRKEMDVQLRNAVKKGQNDKRDLEKELRQKENEMEKNAREATFAKRKVKDLEDQVEDLAVQLKRANRFAGSRRGSLIDNTADLKKELKQKERDIKRMEQKHAEEIQNTLNESKKLRKPLTKALKDLDKTKGALEESENQNSRLESRIEELVQKIRDIGDKAGDETSQLTTILQETEKELAEDHQRDVARIQKMDELDEIEWGEEVVEESDEDFELFYEGGDSYGNLVSQIVEIEHRAREEQQLLEEEVNMRNDEIQDLKIELTRKNLELSEMTHKYNALKDASTREAEDAVEFFDDGMDMDMMMSGGSTTHNTHITTTVITKEAEQRPQRLRKGRKIRDQSANVETRVQLQLLRAENDELRRKVKVGDDKIRDLQENIEDQARQLVEADKHVDEWRSKYLTEVTEWKIKYNTEITEARIAQEAAKAQWNVKLGGPETVLRSGGGANAWILTDQQYQELIAYLSKAKVALGADPQTFAILDGYSSRAALPGAAEDDELGEAKLLVQRGRARLAEIRGRLRSKRDVSGAAEINIDNAAANAHIDGARGIVEAFKAHDESAVRVIDGEMSYEDRERLQTAERQVQSLTERLKSADQNMANKTRILEMRIEHYQGEMALLEQQMTSMKASFTRKETAWEDLQKAKYSKIDLDLRSAKKKKYRTAWPLV
eukprot:TRINITY_DN125_c0_g2_i2.p1 TRINITY_DN125_c0_g2~~TRINITY_DN125_c0_g2_i2.p1  ORF type:complete len:748 (-),score=176.54 TRINITY_DN125_c0_g2_i2:4-2247(-)